MKVNQLVWALLLAGVAAAKLPAQTLQTLCFFNGTDGAFPDAALTLGNDGNFYGTASSGGSGGIGTVFKMTTEGALTTVVSFKTTNGMFPQAALTLGNDGNFYGTTDSGGDTNLNNGYGFETVFKVTTNGTLTTLVSFAYTNGANPNAALTFGNDGNFYGTTAHGGITNSVHPSGMGTVFKVATNGTLTALVSFANTNGANPYTALTLGNDGIFYGTTAHGGISNSADPSGMGTMFKMTTNGTLTTLVSFNGTNGMNPQAALKLGNDGIFYSTTFYGGGNNLGTVFKVTTNGTLTTLVSFANTNGAHPSAALTLGDDGNFYGTTAYGGITIPTYPNGMGTVFKVMTNGTVTALVPFAYTNGANPRTGLTLGNDGIFYGTIPIGGITNSVYPYGMGTVFSLTLTPAITLQPQSQAVVAGSNATFYGTATGAPPFVFQWFFCGEPIADATNTSLTISNFDFTKAGAYSVTVSNRYGYHTAVSVLRLTNSPVVLVDGVDVGGGSVSRVASAQISMSSTFGGNAHIYYTLDGSAPSFLSIPYNGTFQLTQTATIRALAYNSAYVSSAEAAPITVEVVPIYRLISSTPGGGGTAFSPAAYSGGDYFISNTTVTITATPSNGWSFLGWLGDATGPNPMTTLTMTRDMAVQALFGTAITSNALGAGQIWFGRQVPLYPYGTTLAVAAIPQTGSYLINWAGALSGSNNPNVLVVTSPNPIITALFGSLSAGRYALTVLPQGAGSVAVSPYTNRYASGTVVTVTAVPGSGQTFTGWSGDASGAQNPLTLTMTQSKVIGANFTSRPALNTTPPLNRFVEQGFRFSLTGELGMACRIDGSSDLLNWSSLGWLTNDFGTSQFLDAAALTNAAQFYRAVTP